MDNGDGFALNFLQICSLTGITDFTQISHMGYAKKPASS